jgi:cytochrome c
VRLAAHCSESRPWTEGDDFGICQTFAASPAEPGELPCWLGRTNSHRNDEPESMRSTINLPLIAIAGAIFSQLANAEESNLEGRGKELLDARCAHCHAIARTGESPHSAAPPFRTLSRKYPIDELAESLAEGLSVGHPDMPEFVFEPDDITAILAYLNSIQEQ